MTQARGFRIEGNNRAESASKYGGDIETRKVGGAAGIGTTILVLPRARQWEPEPVVKAAMSQYVSLALTQIYAETTPSLDPLYLEMRLRPLRHVVKGSIDNYMVVAAFIAGLAEV